MSDFQKRCQNCIWNKGGICINKREAVINLAKFNFSCKQFKPRNKEIDNEEE